MALWICSRREPARPTRSWGRRRARRSQLSRLRRADSGLRRPLARPDQGRGRACERRARAARRGQGRADRRRGRAGRLGRARRPVPDRRLPDGVGHLLEHERERGARRRSPARTSTRTTTSTWASPRTTSSRAPSTWPRCDELTNDLIPALEGLAAALEAKAGEFDDVVKSGRTHLMDAVPVTLGQEFGGYAAQVRAGRRARRGDAAARRRRSRSAARPSAPGSTRTPSSPSASAAARRRRRASRSCRPPIRSRRRPRATRWSRPRARSRSSPSR